MELYHLLLTTEMLKWFKKHAIVFHKMLSFSSKLLDCFEAANGNIFCIGIVNESPKKGRKKKEKKEKIREKNYRTRNASRLTLE